MPQIDSRNIDFSEYTPVVGGISLVAKDLDVTGVSDSTSTINGAINSLPSTGGRIFLPPGNLRINSTIAMGTKPGVFLQGAGPAVLNNGGSQTQLLVNTPAGIQMGSLASQTPSGGLRDLTVVSGASGAFGVVMDNVIGAVLDNVYITGFTSIGLLLRSGSPGPNTSAHNAFHKLGITVPDVNAAVGLNVAGSGTDQTAYYNSFYDTTINTATVTAAHLISLIYLGMADSNAFYNTECIPNGDKTNIWPVTLDYTANPIWPSDNHFNFISFGTAAFNSGNGVRQLSAPVGAQPNFFKWIELENGFPVHPLLDNLSWEGVRAKTGDPALSNIPQGTYQMWRNNTSGVCKLWFNNFGTLVSVALA